MSGPWTNLPSDNDNGWVGLWSMVSRSHLSMTGTGCLNNAFLFVSYFYFFAGKRT